MTLGSKSLWWTVAKGTVLILEAEVNEEVDSLATFLGRSYLYLEVTMA